MNNDNFLLAVVLSVAILVGFHYFYEKPQMERYQAQVAAKKLEAEKATAAPATPPVVDRPRAELVKEGARVPFDTPQLRGSINLKGGRLDDLVLKNYRQTVDPASANIVLLSPAGTARPYIATFASFGWLGEGVAVPNDATLWQTTGKELTPATPLTLTWDNGQGVRFERTIAVDEHYLFTVTDRVANQGTTPVTLYPFGLVSRKGQPADTTDIYIMHEGPLGVLGGTLKEVKYKELFDHPRATFDSEGGWVGMTDKYWLIALLLGKDDKGTGAFTYDRGGADKPEDGIFQTDFRGSAISLAPGASTDRTLRLFAGAKEVRQLDRYADKFDIPLFDRAIDFGWYYYLTKPFLYLLEYLGSWTGNMGIAILIFTVLLKFMTLPLSLKSYRSMARMKALQPQLVALQERFKNDKTRLSMETMELYKREKVSPVSGCLPNLIQIPIFFALYKVLYVGIELRQAPFFGWIHDLSAPDPTSVLTGFGAVDWSFMPHIGVWPILMGLSMFAQQKLSPQPADKSQATAFTYLPLIFTFMMAKVAAGLIIYWTWSNLLGLAQQWFILHKTTPKKG
jgi:YidC/Oxa1 family membrane protein insertase